MRSYSHISVSLDNYLSADENSGHLKYRHNSGMLFTFYTSLNIGTSYEQFIMEGINLHVQITLWI